jgi:hypothetical protein
VVLEGGQPVQAIAVRRPNPRAALVGREGCDLPTGAVRAQPLPPVPPPRARRGVRGGLALIRQAIAESRAGPDAPGIEAIPSRILPAASTAKGEAATVVAAADAVIAAGPVWAPEAHRVRAASLALRG